MGSSTPSRTLGELGRAVRETVGVQAGWTTGRVDLAGTPAALAVVDDVLALRGSSRPRPS